jgi:hypothetical protein
MAVGFIRTMLFIIATALLIFVFLALASRDDCERGDPGFYLGGMLIAGCSHEDRR